MSSPVSGSGETAKRLIGPDDLGAKAQRQGVDRPEARGLDGGVEDRPALPGLVRRHVDDGLSLAVAVEAGPLVVLQLEQLQQAEVLGGRRHQLQVSPLVGQHQTGCVDAEQLDAGAGQRVQEVDDVEVRDQGVGQLQEDADQSLLGHHAPLHLLVPVPSGTHRVLSS